MLISVVIPVYGCSSCLIELCNRLDFVLTQLAEDYELILVNDASPDRAWETIRSLSVENPRVKGVNLSRNFGQHYAITAGLDFARGDWVILMDCDLQDLPEEIPKLYQRAISGFDMVIARRTERQDGFLKKAFSRIFFAVACYMTETKMNNKIGNFGIYSRQVIQHINLFREQTRSFGLFALWVGFKRDEVEVKHGIRAYGKSSYTFSKMVRLAIDSLVSHSDKLLRLTVKTGLFISFSAILFAAWLVINYFRTGASLAGWTSLIVSIYFTTGLIIGTVGIVGLYVGKIFEEVKRRPLYIIESTTFLDKNDN